MVYGYRNTKQAKISQKKKRKALLTCHHILGRRIAVSAHDSGRDVGLVSFGAVFGEPEIRKLCIVLLGIKKNGRFVKTENS